MMDVVLRALFRDAEHGVRVVQGAKSRGIAGVGVVRVKTLRQQPKYALNGVGISVGTDLKRLVVIELLFGHGFPPRRVRNWRLSAGRTRSCPKARRLSKLTVAGYRLPVTSCRLPVAGCQLPVAGYWLPV